MAITVERKEKGLAAELWVANKIREIYGSVVILSDNEYDMEKDMLIDGVKTEVKSSRAWVHCLWKNGKKEPGVSIVIKDEKHRSNQLPKCMNVDRLLFLVLPTPEHNFNKMLIAELPKDKRKCYELKNVKTVNGIVVKAAFKISDMNILYETTDPEEYKEFIYSGK